MSSKSKIVWICQSCQQPSNKWAGQCHQCKAWNTLIEQVSNETDSRHTASGKKPSSSVWRLQDVQLNPPQRLSTGMDEFDRLLGGGIVPGSLILLGGDPGIGKSTLLLQLSSQIAGQGRRVLYVSGEESIPQISLRAKRLGLQSADLLLVSETRLAAIRFHIETEKPIFVVIDSIQIVYKEEISSAPGSVAQVRECAAEFLHIAKSLGIAILLIGHVTKTGDIAGPRVLEHMVDTVLYFESDVEAGVRLIRSIKNRFGTTDELAVLQMGELGLKEVKNPSALFLRHSQRHQAGCVVVATLEGSRALLVEAQALVTKSFYPQPTRRASGFDPNRLAVLLAVMEKKAGLGLHSCDVFISLAGGLKIQEPALDLGVAVAIASAMTSRTIDPHTAVMAEIGLSGELRPVARSHIRLKELAQMGFRCCICAPGSIDSSHENSLIKVQTVSTLKEALDVLGCLA